MLEQQMNRFLEHLVRRHPVPARVVLPQGTPIDLGPAPRVVLKLKTLTAMRHLLNPSVDTLARAYVEGELEAEGSIRDIVEVGTELAEIAPSPAAGTLPQRWRTHHSRLADRTSIEHHYDVSNEFYQLWLDAGMVYSCAYFKTADDSLEIAQQQKLDLVCRKLRLEPGQRMLDVGCGWGALLIHAARHYGIRGTGITLSSRQLELARERARALGPEERLEFRLQDYRDVPESEPFDRISSVGMVEHVGLANLPAYFAKLHRLLTPGGVLLNHGISSADPDSRSVGLGVGEFIDRYVFPNGELPHVSLAIRELSAAGFELTDVESLRRHYALTLWHWSDRFESRLSELARLAGEKRTRIWRIYLAGCAHGFEVGWMNIYQLQAVKNPGRDQSFPLPLVRTGHY